TDGYTFRSNSTVGGPGLPMQVSGGAVDVDANVSIKNLDVTGAAMLVHGSLNAENIEVSAGKLAIEGTVDVARIDLTGGSLEGGVHIPFTAQTGLLSVSQRLNWVGGALNAFRDPYSPACLEVQVQSTAQFIRST